MDLSRFGLIIFDKDGTLIEFDAMWAVWIEALARRLEMASGVSLSPALFAAMDFDPDRQHVMPGGKLAITPMAGLRRLTAQVLQDAGFSPAAAEAALASAWLPPDLVSGVHPLADLPRLFGALRERGLQIAVATSDDRQPTMATLAGLGLDKLVDVVVGADDGLPIKPAPDMIWSACRQCGVEAGRAIMVGDAVHDLQMARAARAGLAVGVTSGVSTAALLAPWADRLLANVAELVNNA